MSTIALAVVLATISAFANGGCNEKSPLPPDHACGRYGTVNEDTVFKVLQHAESAGDCVNFMTNAIPNYNDLLRNYAGPQLVGYNTTSKICSIYDPSTYPGKVKESSSSDKVFYARECYTCEPDCPQPVGQNLLLNGDFELSSKYDGPWSRGYGDEEVRPTLGEVVSPGSNSSNALFCGGKCENLVQFLRLCKGQMYAVSLDLKYSKPMGNPEDHYPLGITDFLRTTYSRNLDRNPTGNNWVPLEFTFIFNYKPNPEPDIRSILFMGNLGEGGVVPPYYVDNIAVKAVQRPLQTKAGAMEVVENGGFESGKIKPWQATSVPKKKVTVQVVDNGGISGRALRWKFPATFNQFLQAKQTLHLVPGTLYVIRFDCLSPKADIPGVFLILFSGTLGNPDSRIDWNLGPVSKNKVTTFEHRFRADFATVNFDVIFSVPGKGPKNAQYTLIFDNVSVKEAA